MGKILIESRITALLFDTRDSHQRRHHVPIHKLVPAGTAPKDALWHHPPSDSDRTDHPGPDLQQGDRRIRSPRHLDGISAFPDAVIDLPLLDRHPRRTRLSHAPYPTTESLRSSRASMAVYCRHGEGRAGQFTERAREARCCRSSRDGVEYDPDYWVDTCEGVLWVHCDVVCAAGAAEADANHCPRGALGCRRPRRTIWQWSA